jgi:adenosylcobyric acid synthase
MSNNAAVTGSGEIGRAQELQARAARVTPDARMNPVLLKPLADTRSDIVVMGKSQSDLARLPWHDRRAVLWPYVTRALAELRAEADLVVIEGAGSPAETNLRHSDIVNMAVARWALSPVLLAADIDRGGAFASLFGTWSLLSAEDRNHVCGFLLNRFRGDARLLAPAPADLTQRTGVPVLGVIPYVRHTLPQEDAMGLASSGAGDIRIVAIRFPHIANFDDLDPLAAESGVRVQWTDSPADLTGASAIVLPGTRNTIHDLDWLWRTGLGAAVRARASSGTPVLGICGGYQMLGVTVADPHGIEAGGTCPGLDLLDVHTVLEPVKETRWTDACVRCTVPGLPLGVGTDVRGYEIHHGATRAGPAAAPWLTADHGVLGATNANGRGVVFGAYLHALFADDSFRAAFIALAGGNTEGDRWVSRLDTEIERIATAVQSSIDMSELDRIIEMGVACA